MENHFVFLIEHIGEDINHIRNKKMREISSLSFPGFEQEKTFRQPHYYM